MNEEIKSFKVRFKRMFEEQGLENIKFFVRNKEQITLADFAGEVSKIQDTIEAGDVKVIESVDAEFEQRPFNDAF